MRINTNYTPFGLRDSHTSEDLKAVSDQEDNLQVLSSAQGFHTQKTMHRRGETDKLEHNRLLTTIK